MSAPTCFRCGRPIAAHDWRFRLVYAVAMRVGVTIDQRRRLSSRVARALLPVVSALKVRGPVRCNFAGGPR